MTTTKTSIGLDRERFDFVLNSYRQLTSSLTSTWKETRKIFKDMELNDFIIFISFKGDPEYWLQKYHIAKNPDQFRGFDPEKVIKSGLLDLPSLDKITVAHRYTRQCISGSYHSVQVTGLFYPIPKLFNPEAESFDFTTELNQAIIEHCTVYLKSDEQKALYEALQSMLPALNLLKRKGLMELPKFSHNFDRLAHAYFFDGEEFKIKPVLFKTPLLQSFDKIVENTGQLRDIYQI